MALLHARLTSIMRREQQNEDCIYLYDTGDFLIAFERSAYLLERRYPQCEITPMEYGDLARPFIVASLPASAWSPSDKQECAKQGEPAVLKVPRLSLDEYRRWHEEVVMLLQEMLCLEE